MTTQLLTYLRQITKTFLNQSSFSKQELQLRMHFLENDVYNYLKYPKPGRLSFLLSDCTCPTGANIIKPCSSINPQCPIHKDRN